MFLKKVSLTALVMLSSSLPLAAHAGNLVVTNHTQFDSTSIINHGPCSTILGSIGVTHPGQTNVIPEDKIKKACFFNSHNCKADVYMTGNCTGPAVATVLFDVVTGVKSIQMHDAAYTINGSAFNLTLEGGPA